MHKASGLYKFISCGVLVLVCMFGLLSERLNAISEGDLYCRCCKISIFIVWSFRAGMEGLVLKPHLLYTYISSTISSNYMVAWLLTSLSEFITFTINPIPSQE